MKFLRVRTAEDLRPLTTRADPGTELREDVVVIFEKSHITIPFEYPGWFFQGLKNCYFLGATSPKKKVLLDGYPFFLTDCDGIHVADIAMRLDRPFEPHATYEKWWNSPKVLTTDPDKPSRNIAFHRCSMSGNTDEIDCGPDNHSMWPAAAPTAIDGLEFYQCVVGPSFRGFMSGRGKHNFGIAATHVVNANIQECLFVGHNRRCPQIKGEAIIRDCLINGAGTMAVGLYGGSTVDVINTVHVPSLTTATKWVIDTAAAKRRVPVVSVVTGTPWREPIELFVSGVHECFTTRKHGSTNLSDAQQAWAPRSNEDAVINVEPVNLQLMGEPNFASMSGYVPVVDPWQTLERAGVQDQLDVECAEAVRAGTMPWIYNYGDAGRMSLPLGDYVGFAANYVLPSGNDQAILNELLCLNVRP